MPSRSLPALVLPTAVGPAPHTAFLGGVLRALRTLADGLAERLDAGPFHPKQYLVAERPPAPDHPGGVIYVPDAAANQKLQYSDGTNWIAAG